jgi:nucleoside 2-deoxyribosyltransferase
VPLREIFYDIHLQGEANMNHIHTNKFSTDKIKVYLSARIAEDAHQWNNCVCNSLDERFEVFKPQEHNPYNMDHRRLPKSVYEMDLKAMQESDIGLLLSPYGRDCAWEVGWYSRSNKPIVLYVEKDTTWLRDWMVKGGVDLVIVAGQALYDRIKEDAIVADKIRRLDARSQLSDVLFEVFANSPGGRVKLARTASSVGTATRALPLNVPLTQNGAMVR